MRKFIKEKNILNTDEDDFEIEPTADMIEDNKNG